VDESPASRGPWQPRIVVDPRPFDRAGELLAAAIGDVLAEKERVRLAIPGGSALEAVRRARAILGEEWKRVVLTWVDERCVPAADDDSNRGAATRLGLLASGPAFVLPLFEDGESPTEALCRFLEGWQHDLSEGLDVALLGMGPDGHVASLFPSSRPFPKKGWVAHIKDSPKPPSDRITLTRDALATAKHVILVAAGDKKRAAVRRLVSGDPALPASGIEGLVIVTDGERAAKAELES